MRLRSQTLKSFVSGGASVMTGEHNGVAARLKCVNKGFPARNKENKDRKDITITEMYYLPGYS